MYKKNNVYIYFTLYLIFLRQISPIISIIALSPRNNPVLLYWDTKLMMPKEMSISPFWVIKIIHYLRFPN